MNSYIAHRFITMLATDKSPGLVLMYPALLKSHPDLRPFEAGDPKKIAIRPEDIYPSLYKKKGRSILSYRAHNFDEVRRSEAPAALETVHTLISAVLRDLVPLILDDAAEKEQWDEFLKINLSSPSHAKLAAIDKELDVLAGPKTSKIHGMLKKAIEIYASYVALDSFWSGGPIEKVQPENRSYANLEEYVKDKIRYYESTDYELAAGIVGIAVSYMLRLVPYIVADEFRARLDNIVNSIARTSYREKNPSLKSFIDSTGIDIDISGTGNPEIANKIEEILSDCMIDLTSLTGSDPSRDFSPKSVERAIREATKNDSIEAVLSRITKAVSACIELAEE